MRTSGQRSGADEAPQLLSHVSRVAELTISGAECVEALCTAGFRVRRRAVGQTVLVRAARTIVVPDRLVLSPELLEAILAEADLPVERFLWLLGEVSTKTEIPCDA